MRVCTFFGHRDCPDSVRSCLRNIITELIEQHQVDTFYVGNQGKFDSIVRVELDNLSLLYPHIHYTIVLAYMPNEKTSTVPSHTLLPEGIELVPPRFAISWRNNWMLHQSEYVICYVSHPGSGATHWYEKALSGNKVVYNLATDSKTTPSNLT